MLLAYLLFGRPLAYLLLFGRPLAYLLFGRPRYCQPVNFVNIFHIAFLFLRLTGKGSGLVEVQILHGYNACTFTHDFTCTLSYRNGMAPLLIRVHIVVFMVKSLKKINF